MRIYHHTAFTVIERYYIVYHGHKSDAGVCSGRRRRFLFDIDFASAQCFETFRNRCARFRCVFGSTDSYEGRKNWVSLA